MKHLERRVDFRTYVKELETKDVRSLTCELLDMMKEGSPDFSDDHNHSYQKSIEDLEILSGRRKKYSTFQIFPDFDCSNEEAEEYQWMEDVERTITSTWWLMPFLGSRKFYQAFDIQKKIQNLVNSQVIEYLESYKSISFCFHGDVVITDPIYLFKYSELNRLGEGVYADTIYGDWICKVLSNEETIGTFCADSGQVCAVAIDDFIKEKLKEHKDDAYTILKDFNGVISIIHYNGECWLEGSGSIDFCTKQYEI